MKTHLWVLAVVTMLSCLPQAALADCDYTHGELVDHLIQITNLQDQLPKDIALYSEDEAYLVKVRLLLIKGYPEALDGFERGYVIDRGYFVSLVYDAMKMKTSCPAEELPDKTECLTEKGFLPKELETRLCKECQSVTHGELVGLIIKFAGLQEEIEKELQGKDEDERYRYEVSYLLTLAFPKRLDGYTRQFMITRGYFAEVMYDIFADRIGCPAVTTKEKALCLVRAGYLQSDDLARTLCRDEVVLGLGRIRRNGKPPDGHILSPTW
jgi:hypothetical protein